MLNRVCRIFLLLCLALTSISMIHAQDIELPESEASYTAVFPSLEFSFDYADLYMGMRAEENRIMLQWRDSYTLGLSIVPVLTITVDESQPLDEAVDAIIDELNLVDPTIIDDELDDVPVKIMEAKVYASRWRWLLINRNDRLYTFEILPADEPTMPTESLFAEKLWDDTINSLKFDDLPEFNADCEDDSEFVEDITIPDGMPVGLSIPIFKTWRLANDGTCSWNADYALNYVGGTEVWRWMEGSPSPIIPYAQPGDEVDITMVLLLPPEYFGDFDIEIAQFQLANPDGELFGATPYVAVQPLRPTR